MSEDDDCSVIIVCQGPPRCSLEGDAAYEAQKAGCVWCSRISIDGDEESVSEPGNA